MTALTNDTNRVFEVNNDSNAVALAAGTKVFQGSLIGKTATGYGRALEAGDTAMGFAKDNVDNTDGTDGEKIVEVKSMGKVSLFISGLTIADIGKDVYASDDNTFTLTSTDNSKVGKIIRFEKSDYAIVYFNFLS
ncbi:MAG: hypothetical protein Q4F75_01540 [Pseudomonadota bacterium]|nr:hypothetical protein [Pseudomonadota bacterium]